MEYIYIYVHFIATVSGLGRKIGSNNTEVKEDWKSSWYLLICTALGYLTFWACYSIKTKDHQPSNHEDSVPVQIVQRASNQLPHSTKSKYEQISQYNYVRKKMEWWKKREIYLHFKAKERTQTRMSARLEKCSLPQNLKGWKKKTPSNFQIHLYNHPVQMQDW